MMKTTVRHARLINSTSFEARIQDPGLFSIGDLFWYDSEQCLLELSRKKGVNAEFRALPSEPAPLASPPPDGSELILDMQACEQWSEKSWTAKVEFPASASSTQTHLANRVVRRITPSEPTS